MQWLTCISQAIEYIEHHLHDDIRIDDVAASVNVSTFYLQKGFEILTNHTIGEYIKGRKLYMAYNDLMHGNKIIDVAYNYGYETPEAFSKAFKRFHGFNPSKVSENKPKIFDPITININIIGGKKMDLKYKIVDMFPLKLIGFVRTFNMKDAYTKIPMFWDEICEKYCYPRIYQGLDPINEYEKAIVDNCIGEYGVCIDCHEETFKYLIAGKYCGGKIPDGMEVYEFKAKKWAIFDCIGPCPKSLQELNSKIFKEWLPQNKQYTLSGDGNIEWYDCLNGNKEDANYHTQIWIPIEKINSDEN